MVSVVVVGKMGVGRGKRLETQGCDAAIGNFVGKVIGNGAQFLASSILGLHCHESSLAQNFLKKEGLMLSVFAKSAL